MVRLLAAASFAVAFARVAFGYTVTLPPVACTGVPALISWDLTNGPFTVLQTGPGGAHLLASDVPDNSYTWTVNLAEQTVAYIYVEAHGGDDKLSDSFTVQPATACAAQTPPTEDAPPPSCPVDD